jgi:muramoyltetrapeptide carboxypeptidase
MLPGPLRRGDVVRVIAPASPFDPAMLERGLSVLRDRLGLVPRHRPDLGARNGYLAGDDARRLDEWREAVDDPEARAIFCARGGYGAMRLLPQVDPAPLLAAPKVLVGFSDVTALHAVLNRAGLATVHGPVLTQLGRAPAGAVAHLAALLTQAPSPGEDGAAELGIGLSGTATVRPGRVEGPVLGGSLTLLSHLCGTPYLPSFAGAILLLEDVDERPYRLDRYLTQLDLSGAVQGLAGVALGQFTNCDGQGVVGAAVVRGWAAALGVPVIEGLPVGHEDANYAVPLGAQATLVAPGPGEPGPPRLTFDLWGAPRQDSERLHSRTRPALPAAGAGPSTGSTG